MYEPQHLGHELAHCSFIQKCLQCILVRRWVLPCLKATFLIGRKVFWMSKLLPQLLCCRAVVRERDLESARATLDTREHCATNAWTSSLLRSRMRHTLFANVSHFTFCCEIGDCTVYMCACVCWSVLASLGVVHYNTGEYFLRLSICSNNNNN